MDLFNDNDLCIQLNKSLYKIRNSNNWINSANNFCQQPQVINGFSELMREVFGEDRGIGARSAMATNTLPGNIAVEIELIFELAE
mgnify:CR=1 FL=1